MEFRQSCGMMQNGEVTPLSLPLQTLKNEHIPLRKQMEELLEEATQIVSTVDVQRVKGDLGELRIKVVKFVGEIDPHSEIEEGVLFPLVANYIGREVGPIAVMEYEHDQAKKHLKTFLNQTLTLDLDTIQEEYKGIAENVIQATNILFEHFMKEENVLFPLAENMLTLEEKNELQRKINAPK